MIPPSSFQKELIMFNLSSINDAINPTLVAQLIECRETMLEKLIRGPDLSDKDRVDLRPILIECSELKPFDMQRVLPIIRQVAGRHKDWRNFLTVANVHEFLMDKCISIMDSHARILDQHKHIKIDFTAEFLAFLAHCFVVAYRP
jgi:hypothetical protein